MVYQRAGDQQEVGLVLAIWIQAVPDSLGRVR
jgi:hypothetical protein